MPAHEANLSGQDSVENFIREYPNREQTKMMRAWLTDHEPGTFSFTGLVDPTDTTVVTPQATVDYGYCWFSLSEAPATVHTPRYDKFFSVSIFDMRHNVPAVIVSPERPILLIRPGQELPEGEFEIVELETDQGLVLTRMVVVNNAAEVAALGRQITMNGGHGDMHRDVQRFSAPVEAMAMDVLKATLPHADPDQVFGKKTGDSGEIRLAAGVMLGQLGTPADTVRYSLILTDSDGAPFNGNDTYVITVPAGINKPDGYFSLTVYGSDNKLLIPNDQGVYDQTSYTAAAEPDGTYKITLSPDGNGQNAIPTGKPFYALLRAYVPTPGADLAVKAQRI